MIGLEALWLRVLQMGWARRFLCSGLRGILVSFQVDAQRGGVACELQEPDLARQVSPAQRASRLAASPRVCASKPSVRGGLHEARDPLLQPYPDPGAAAVQCA